MIDGHSASVAAIVTRSAAATTERLGPVPRRPLLPWSPDHSLNSLLCGDPGTLSSH